MLAAILRSFDLSRQFWAELVGCSPKQLDEWLAGQRELPLSIARRFSALLGVSSSTLLEDRESRLDAAAMLPPLWLKAREQGFGAREHRAIAIARLLATKYEQVSALMEPTSDGYRLLFNEVRSRVDSQSPAGRQGAVAADAFLEMSALAQGRTGVGEVLRGALRARGLLVLETPISQTGLEGFCVPVGTQGGRPCLLVNSYRTTWFRRNYVLLHELAHAIFDLDGTTAVFDMSQGAATRSVSVEIAESRADAFAMSALLPKQLLVALESRGFRLAELDETAMAEVVHRTHAEQRLIVRAALEYGLIDSLTASRLAGLDIARELRGISYHARGLASLKAEELIYPEVRHWADRMTTFPIAGIRLPIPFVRLVLEALRQDKITAGRAAELLGVTRDELSQRYGIHSEVLA